MHILPNISGSKGNQTMKFGQLIVCNMRNILLEQSFTKCGGKTSPRPFSEILKLSISLDQQSKDLYSLLLFYGYRNISKLNCRPLAFTLSFLKKQKDVWNQSPSLIFRIIFAEKYLTCYVLLIDQLSLSGCLYFVRYWAIFVLQLFVNQILRS